MNANATNSGCPGCTGCTGCAGRICAAPALAPTVPPAAHAWLDRLFLHPRWGLVGSALVFGGVLFVVFQVSAWLDAMTTARLADALSGWQPHTTGGVIGRAVADGLVGLVGIVVPYMIPLVMLLVALEQCGIMPRIARVIDRAFHRIGVHGGVAVSFLTGLGCNVPAISNAAATTRGRERLTACVLITFVPCSARSAIILALAGKYLGAWAVLAIFAASAAAIAILGRLLSHRGAELDAAAAHPIPPYALPRARALLATTWQRSRDVVTIVMPLLIVGSVALALLTHVGADRAVNALLAPLTAVWLGLPLALGVPLLFGVLRKELSLLMIFQALGTLDVGTALDPVQLMTLLLFLTFYVPCLSTFAVMLRALGARLALQSVAISLGAALVVAGTARVAMQWAVSLAA
jgi:ferrous iron transport protein B